MKKILLHTCCAPCLTASKEHLENEAISSIIFWYNPNIEPKEEHDKRQRVLKDFLKKVKAQLLDFEDDYAAENKKWHDHITGFEAESEGGQRCKKCIEFRLAKTMVIAQKLGLDFSTTLTVSPHKNTAMIDEVGERLSCNSFVKFMPKNFKKKDGYKRSIELSKEFNLYRQSYCGCRYSNNSHKS